MRELFLLNKIANAGSSNNRRVVLHGSEQIEFFSNRLELHLCKDVYELLVGFARPICPCTRFFLSTKALMLVRPIIVGWFHTNLNNSKSFRVDSNCTCAKISMNRWTFWHVRVFKILGASNNSVPGPIPLTRICYSCSTVA